jgi:hypothetical protein
VVRSLDEPPAEPGLHRVYWDLLSDETPKIALRTPPVENPRIRLGEDGTRALDELDRFRVLAPPGRYTVRLSVGEQRFEQPLVVLQDPASQASADELAEQTALVTEVQAALERAAAIVNGCEWLRVQIDQLEARLAARPKERPAPSEVMAAARSLDEELLAVEGELFDPRLTGAIQDTLRWKRLIYSRLLYLGWQLQGSDFRPTDAQVAVFRMLEGQLAAVERRFEAARGDALDALNARLREADLAGVMVPER